MATILDSKLSSYSPYLYYTFLAEEVGRTSTTAKIKVTCKSRFKNSEGWIGTGSTLTAGIYIGGSWHNFTIKDRDASWNRGTTHSSSATFTISVKASTNKLTDIKCRVLNSSGTPSELNPTSAASISVSYPEGEVANASLSKSNVTQKSCKLTLSGMSSASVSRAIKWYNGSSLVATTTSATGTSYNMTVNGLMPNTSYTFKAKIYSGDDLLKTCTVNAQTPSETGTLSVSSSTTYATLTMGGMFSNPTYKRTVYFYYKKHSSSTYTLIDKIKTQGTSAKVTVKNLVSGLTYDYKAVVKNDSGTSLKTSTASSTTPKDTSLVPTPSITEVVQIPGTTTCSVSWITNKQVSGTTYTVKVKLGASGSWTTFTTLSKVISPLMIDVSMSGDSVVLGVQIVASNPSSADTHTATESTTVYKLFEWDYVKTAGYPIVIGYAEWNRLREYAIRRNGINGRTADEDEWLEIIPTVSQGDPISADTYNRMKNLINDVSRVAIDGVLVNDVKVGDPITAEEINALAEAINREEI